MGCFTWTLANRKPEFNRYDDYKSKCKLPYGGRGVVVCPDDTHIEELHYEGYGIFDGQDIYDLVTEWNRPYLSDIFRQIPEIEKTESFWGHELRDMAEAYQHNDMEKVSYEILKLESCKGYPWIRDDWKRNIGIAIACEDEIHEIIPYQIKIVNNKRIRKYADLPFSRSCQ